MTPSPVPVVVVTGSLDTDWWAQVLDGVLGAGISAVVTLLAAVYVLKRTLRSERDSAKEERAAAAADQRRQMGLGAAARLLALLAELEAAWVRSALPTLARRDGGEPAMNRHEAYPLLRMAVLADVPLLHDREVARRLDALLGLAQVRTWHLAAADDVWQETYDRALHEFLAYEEHCRKSLEALINDEPLAAALPIPALVGHIA